MDKVTIPATVEVALQQKNTVRICRREEGLARDKDAGKIEINRSDENPELIQITANAKDSYARGTAYITLSQHYARTLVTTLAKELGLVVREA